MAILLTRAFLSCYLQTDALIEAGVPCAKLDSTLEVHEVRDIYAQVNKGNVVLVPIEI